MLCCSIYTRKLTYTRFASTFNFLDQGCSDENFLKASETNAAVWEILGTIPWINMVLHKIVPYHPYTRVSLVRGEKTLAKRMSTKGLIRKDIFYHLMDEDGMSGHPPLSHGTLISESMLVLIAGSDTAATAMSNVFFYLLTQPDVLTRLRDEIEKAVPPEVHHPDSNTLAQLPYLRAVINETLRLNPGVPGGVHRRPPPNGGPAFIGDIIIPQGTTVQVPIWSVHRDPRYFWPHPETFWPERWLDGAEKTTADFKLNMSAYIPFSLGPTSCAGKHIAMNEMRLAIVTLLRNFDFRLESKLDCRDWEKKQSEIFVLMTGELPVTVTPRA
jgi:cytochrome P450